MKLLSAKYLIIAIGICAALWSCTDNEQFRVNGTIAGKPNLNLRMCYYADGAYRSQIAVAREGEFEIYGRSKGPALVEIYDYDYKPLARLYASNGETFELELDRSKPYEPVIKGNAVSERWAAALRDNAAALSSSDAATSNAAIEAYVAAHPNDIVSTLLMLTSYDASVDAVTADSVMSLIAPQARPSSLTESFNQLMMPLVTEDVKQPLKTLRYIDHRDSTEIFRSADSHRSIIAFVDVADDAVSRRLNALDGRATLELRLNADIRRNSLPDSLGRPIGRMPGGVVAHGISRLGIPDLPFYIVVDSAGTQLYRGSSLNGALAALQE